MNHLFITFIFILFGSIFAFAKNTETATEKSRKLSAYFVSDRFHKLDDREIPEWESVEVMQDRFEEIRDARFILSDKNILRRIPWLYPDDGCHTRAHLFIQQAVEKGYEKPKRVFLFGVLDFDSPYFLKQRDFDYWFHTAPIVKVDGVVYVLDPTINFEKPLTIEKWALKLTPDFDNVNFAYCSGDTYKQTFKCKNPKIVDEDMVEIEIEHYLAMEWNRLRNLEMDPYRLLLNSKKPTKNEI